MHSTKLKNILHKIRIPCTPDLIISSFPGETSQVIINLNTNAIDHAFTENCLEEIIIKVEYKNANITVEH